MSKKISFFEALCYGSGSFLIVSVISVLNSVIYARCLDKSGLGLYGVISATVNMFLVISSFSLGQTATRYISYLHDDKKAKEHIIYSLIIMCIILASIVCTLFYLSFPLQIKYIYKDPAIQDILLISIVWLFVASWTSLSNGILQGLFYFREQSKLNIFIASLSVPLNYFFINILLVKGLILSLIAQNILLLMLSHWYIWKHLPLTSFSEVLKYLVKFKQILIQFSAPTTLMNFVAPPLLWIGTTLIAKSQYGLQDVAILNIANGILLLIGRIPSLVASSALPFLTNSFSSLDGDRLKAYSASLARVISCITITIIVFMIIFGKNIISFLYGNQYIPSWSLLFLFSFGFLMTAPNEVNDKLFAAVGKQWQSFGFNILWGILFGFCILVFIPKWGAKGYAISYVLAYIVYTLFQFRYTRELLGIKWTHLYITIVWGFLGIIASYVIVNLFKGSLFYLLSSLFCFVFVIITWRYFLHNEDRRYIVSKMASLIRQLKENHMVRFIR